MSESFRAGMSMFLPDAPHYALDDHFLRARMEAIVRERSIEVVVETGVHAGLSTVAFAQFAPRVVGVEVDPVCCAVARARCADAGVENVEIVQGDSPEVIERIAPTLPADHALWFLDAHWGPKWPLLDEIAAIPRGAGIIVVHDFRCPGRTDGFDIYDGKRCEYEYVAEALTAWSPTHGVEYATEFSGGGVGTGFIFPKVR